jgi:hypothetical protein
MRCVRWYWCQERRPGSLRQEQAEGYAEGNDLRQHIQRDGDRGRRIAESGQAPGSEHDEHQREGKEGGSKISGAAMAPTAAPASLVQGRCVLLMRTAKVTPAPMKVTGVIGSTAGSAGRSAPARPGQHVLSLRSEDADKIGCGRQAADEVKPWPSSSPLPEAHSSPPGWLGRNLATATAGGR